MFFDSFDLLNEYDTEKKVFLISISSSKITEFNTYYQYIVKRINELGNNELQDDFSTSLKVLFNNLKSTIQPYENVLEKFDLNEIGMFFNHLVDRDPEEYTSEILNKLAYLITEFKSGNIPNKMYDEYLKYSELQGGDSVVISYYIPESKKIHYSSVYKYVRGNKFYDTAFFLGTPNLYGDTTIFKAHQTFYLGYNIYSMDLPIKKILIDNIDENSSIYKDLEIIKISEKNKENPKILLEEPKFDSYVGRRIDINALKKKYIREIDNVMSCEANLVAFLSNHYIFYTNKSNVNVINKENGLVEKKNLKSVKEFEWIIIRTASDEEYLKKESKKEIGELYDYYYSEVVKYKELLQEKITHEYGTLESLNRKLKDEEINVHRNLLKQWVYGDTIAPIEKNYYKILKFLNYSDEEISKLIGYYKKIRSSRMRAGRKLSGIFQTVVDRISIETIREEMLDSKMFIFNDSFGEFRIEEVLYVDNEVTHIEMSDLYKLRLVNNVDKSKYTNEYFD